MASRSVSARRRGRSFLDDLLVSALDRAVALEEVDRVAVVIRKDLHLDVARPLQDELLDQQIASSPKAAAGLARAPKRGASEKSFADRPARMPRPPPPADRLDEHRVADPASGRLGEVTPESWSSPS